MRAKILFTFALVFTCLTVGAYSAVRITDATPNASRLGLEAKNGIFTKDGKPYRGIGVNYFDAFYRTLHKPDDTSYRAGFKALAERGISFARFTAMGFWPVENKLYLDDKERYFKLFDGVVKAAEEQGIGLIPSFFWNCSCVPDLVGEPLDQWGNPKSKTSDFMRQYVRDVVTRYRNSPAIWGYEFGNEFNLGADLPNAREHRPQVVPRLGTAKSRSERDQLTHDIIRAAFKEFAKEVRKYDKRRVIISGNSAPRPSAWHQRKELSWTQDTKEQYAEMLAGDNPDPIDTLCIHLYPGEQDRFNRAVTFEEFLKLSLDAAAKNGKPLFVGEFGAGGKTDAEAARKSFTELLAAIESTGVPLAALWVYDYPGQDNEWNVTPTNDRAYQLEAIAEANRRIQRTGSAVEKTMKLPQSDRPLAERFLDPPAASRILPIIHGWPDEEKAQDERIHKLIVQGFGGSVSSVAWQGYLENEEKWQAYIRAVNKARELGMSQWLYDERGYPSGTAGNIVLRDHPELEARGLLIADTVSEGGPVNLDLPPGKLMIAAAFPVNEGSIQVGKAVDLSSKLDQGKLAWEAPPGKWRVMLITEDRVYEGTHAALSLANKEHYINLLMPEPTARFLEVNHDQYAKRLGADLGKWFVATFTDEPSLMSVFLSPMPYRILPWSPNLPVEFQKRRGYALEPLIPGLVADAGAEGSKARYDFWLTVGELVSENFFGQIQTWCHKHKLLSGGHPLWEEDLRNHVGFYGDFFRCIRRLDAPSIDCLTSLPAEVPWHIARLTGSAADLEGNAVTMCETSDFSQRYRPQGDQRPARHVTEDEIRGACNRLILGGITTITSYYSFEGLSDEEIRRINEWVGRCSTMLTGGHQVTDIAVLYPIESLWPRFTPARHGATDSETARLVQDAYYRVSYDLFSDRRDFTYIDSRTLAEAKVRNGELSFRGMKWRAIVLPCVDTLPMAAWENLERFWRTGGVVVAVGAVPANSEAEFPSPNVQKLAEAMFGATDKPNSAVNEANGVGILLPAGSEGMLNKALDAVLEHDVTVADTKSPLRCTHRRIDGHEVYFIINDSAESWEGQISLAVRGKGEQWNPATGKMTALESGDKVTLNLGPYGGMLLRFQSANRPARLKLDSTAPAEALSSGQ